MNEMPHNQRRPKERFRRICVFCSGGKISGEHIWSRWMKDLIPTLNSHHSWVGAISGTSTFTFKKNYVRRGNLTGWKVRAVCQVCNNGWMSMLEERARSTVTALVTGQPQSLSPTDSDILRRWIVMKLIVLDRSTTGANVITVEAAARFREHGQIPANLAVWILHCGDPNWKANFRGHTCSIQIDLDAPPPDKMNTKSFALGLGEAMIYAFYGDPRIMHWMTPPASLALQLVPAELRDISWPPSTRLDGTEADILSNALAIADMTARSMGHHKG